jgi:hypothetical protein
LRAFQEGNSCLLSPDAPDSPVHHRTLSGADFFPSLAKPTVGGSEPLAHRTLSDVHRIVRCPLLTVGSATHRARITRPTVGRQAVGSPDSPVNFSRTPPMTSRERPVRQSQPGAPDTVRCGFLSFFGEADRWRFRAVGAPDTVRCTPDSPVPTSDRWLCHASRADYAADRWPGRLLAHRTVR